MDKSLYNGVGPAPQNRNTNPWAVVSNIPFLVPWQWQGAVKVVGQKDEEPLARLKRRVLKPIEEKIYSPLNRLFDRLGYVSAALVLVAITGLSAVAIKLWNDPGEAKRVITVIRFYWEARQPTPPRSVNVTAEIRDLTNQLKDAISPSNRNRLDVGGDWAHAQMAVSLQGEDAFDVQDLVQLVSQRGAELSLLAGRTRGSATSGSGRMGVARVFADEGDAHRGKA